jgi:ABC-type sugar transport system permease subunit
MNILRKTSLIRSFATISLLFSFLSHSFPAERVAIQSNNYIEEGADPFTLARVTLYRNFLVQNPDVVLVPYLPPYLPEAVSPPGRSRLLFALAGEAGPDHLVTDLEEFQLYLGQNLLYPLDEFIFDVLKDGAGRTVNPDGHPIDPREESLFYRVPPADKYSMAVSIDRRTSICPEWDGLSTLLQGISIQGDKVYGIPLLDEFTCLVARRDLLVAAGLNPDAPPQDWDDFIYWAQELTQPDKPIRGAAPQRGRYGFASAVSPSSEWLNYLWQADGDAVRKLKFCPAGHRIEANKEAELPQKCPLCGKGLLHSLQSWTPAFNSDAGIIALHHYRRLRSLRWSRCPRCREPVNVPLRTDPALPLLCDGPKGCRYSFSPPRQVYRGVIREIDPENNGNSLVRVAGLLERGEVAMALVTGPYRFVAGLSLPVENIVMMPLPIGSQWIRCPRCRERILLTKAMKEAGKAACPRDSTSIILSAIEIFGGRSANLVSVKMWAMNSSSPGATRNALWKLFQYRMSPEAASVTARFLIDEGYLRGIQPSNLLLAGHPKLYGSLPASWVEAERRGLASARLAPFSPNWRSFMETDMRALLSAVSSEGEQDFFSALARASARCEIAIGSENPAAAEMHGKGILGILVPLAILLVMAFMWLSRALHPAPTRAAAHPPRGAGENALPWLLLAPALLLLLLWVCLPVITSARMAFYDWTVVGQKRFVGTQNFAAILSSAFFWRLLLQTFLFVMLTVVLGFAAPILLALLLAEIPRGRFLFRTLLYLPAVAGGLAVALLWRLMYDPTEKGFLNWLLTSMPRPTYLVLPLLLMVAFAALSALFFKRREFLPGIVLMALSLGLVLCIPQIQPLRRRLDWLGSPAAGGIGSMLCIVFVGTWAAAGPGSMIYIAALRRIPLELYESAELDGAGVFAKVRHISLSELKPLVTLNLIGVVVGSFQAIRNIFVMTGGDPQGRTRVLALDTWYNAFVYLRFGYAAALAWILTGLVVGFAVYELRRLAFTDFRLPWPRLQSREGVRGGDI